jgi:hypothetical protein
MKRSVKSSIQQRVTANRLRVRGVVDREERGAEAIRALNRQATKNAKPVIVN